MERVDFVEDDIAIRIGVCVGKVVFAGKVGMDISVAIGIGVDRHGTHIPFVGEELREETLLANALNERSWAVVDAEYLAVTVGYIDSPDVHHTGVVSVLVVAHRKDCQ